MDKNCYHRTEEALNKVKKQIDNLKKICIVYDVPMFVTAAIQDTENGTEYYSAVHGAASHHVELKDDRIQNHILVQNGFVPVPPRESVTIDSGVFNVFFQGQASSSDNDGSSDVSYTDEERSEMKAQVNGEESADV